MTKRNHTLRAIESDWSRNGVGKRVGRNRNVVMSMCHFHLSSILFSLACVLNPYYYLFVLIVPYHFLLSAYFDSLKGRGLAAGIPHFNLDRLASSSMASHRLIQHVGRRYGLNVSETLYDRLNV